jgi:hypothetical protein
MFPDEFVRPMREELTRVGFQELRTPQEVDAALQQEKRRRQGSSRSRLGSGEPGAPGNSHHRFRRSRSRRYGARPRLFRGLRTVVPFHRLAARWQAGLHDGAIQHRKPRCASHRRRSHPRLRSLLRPSHCARKPVARSIRNFANSSAAIRHYDAGAVLQKFGEIRARRESFFADELPPEDSDLTAEVRVARVENLRPRSAVDQQKFFRSHQK